MDMAGYWQAVLDQDRESLETFFWEHAQIRWHNTNECFTVPEFIRANCDYPGTWDGQVEKVMELGDQVVTVTRVYNRERTMSCHAVSFLRIRADKILSVDEYWGDDGQPPRWRQELHLGRPIIAEV